MSPIPEVSVVLPTFDRLAYLKQAIASVLAQTYRHWELNVVDDGSTDGTREYLAALSDPRIRVIQVPHCGNPARLRNLALARAAGRYVAFLDSDDLWMSAKLERQLADLAAKPSCRWSYTYFDRIGEHGESVALPPGRRPRPDAGWVTHGLVAGTAWVATPTVVAERRLLEEIGGFDETLPSSEDYDAYLKLSRLSEIALLAEPLAAVRWHPGNSWKNRPVELIAECQVRVYDRVLAGAREPEVRAACRLERARARIWLAEQQRGHGDTRRALAALGRGALDGWRLQAWWVSLAKSVLRPLLPAAALDAWRARRRRA